jgi:WD40 repeat protein
MALAFFPDGKRLVTAGGPVWIWNMADGSALRRMQCRYGSVFNIVVSPDGGIVVPCGTSESGSGQSDIRFWDAATGEEIRRFSGHKDMVFAVAFSADGKYLASASDDHTLRLWDLATGKTIREFIGHDDYVQAVALSRDGKSLISGSKDGTVRLWELNSGKEIRRIAGPRGDIRSIALSLDGKLVAWAFDGQPVSLAETATGNIIRRLKMKSGGYPRVVFSPDGKTIACGAYPGPARLWDVASGDVVRELTGPDAVSDLAFSPDGTILAAAGYGSAISRWEVATGKCLANGIGHSGPVLAVAFSSDGRAVYSVGLEGTVRSWNAATAKSTGQFEIGRQSPWHKNAVAFSPGGALLSTAGPSVWDVGTGSRLKVFGDDKASAGTVTFSADGKTIAVAGNPVSLWDVASGNKTELPRRDDNQMIVGLAVSSGGQVCAEAISLNAMREYGWINLRDVTAKTTLRLGGDGRFMHYYGVNLSPDGKTLVSASAGDNRGGIDVWDVPTGAHLRSISSRHASSMAFSPDGKMLATSIGYEIQFWDMANGKALGGFHGPFTHITCLAFSPDGKRLVTGCGDSTVLVWPVDDRKRSIRWE